MQTETFGAGSDEQNLARAEGFQKMVEASGQEWPDGWVMGEGFVRPRADADPMKPPPTVAELGEEIRPWLAVYRRFYGFYYSSAHHFDEHLYAWCLRQLQGSPEIKHSPATPGF